MNTVQYSLFSSFEEDQENAPEIDIFAKTINQKNLLKDLFKAYYDARKNKRKTNAQLAFEKNYEQNLFDLWEEIIFKSYHPEPSSVFIKTKPVIREVFAASFKDRVVHHYLFNILSPLYEKQFINDSYSCRKGKGTLYGIKRVQGFLQKMHLQKHHHAYILKLDIQNYFYSLDRKLLFDMIVQKLETQELLGYDKSIIIFLLKKVIFNDPTHQVIKKGTSEEWKKLPKSKSLFYAKPGKGFAIGNLTSQLFSNIYLDAFDHFVKEKLHISCYGRYVDDFVLVHHSAEYLKSCIPPIQDFLNSIGLTLHPKKQYFQHYKKGLPFLGAYIKPFVRFVENRTKKNAYEKVRNINFCFQSTILNSEQKFKIRSQLNSYLGIMKPHSSFRLRKNLLHFLHSNFWKSFQPRADYSAVLIL